jgi:hypothetical protein
VANPGAWIEVGREIVAVRAVVATEPERARLFAAHAGVYPQFDYYQGKTKRLIPMVLLCPDETVRMSDVLSSSYRAAKASLTVR